MEILITLDAVTLTLSSSNSFSFLEQKNALKLLASPSMKAEQPSQTYNTEVNKITQQTQTKENTKNTYCKYGHTFRHAAPQQTPHALRANVYGDEYIKQRATACIQVPKRYIAGKDTLGF